MAYTSKRFDDRLFRWIGIPATGILFYGVCSYLNASFRRPEDFLLNQLYFIFISFTIWHGNMRLGNLLKNPINKFNSILARIFLRYLATIVFTFCVTFILMLIWNKVFQHNAYSYAEILIVQLVETFISVLIGSMYVTVYLNRAKEKRELIIERIEKQKIQAQLDALKSQLDPHFIFNSLNTLSYLITTDAEKAKLFNDTLAKVYRYVLINKEKDMVPLHEEIEFTRNNYYLLKIRYQTGLKMSVKLDNIVAENYIIPPLSLQTLVENAIKHNSFSEKSPLHIKIIISDEGALVTNNKMIKKFDVRSSKIGLVNLKERYKLIAKKNIIIDEDNQRFSVLLPLLIADNHDIRVNY